MNLPESMDDPERFAALKAAFFDACQATPDERAALLERLQREDEALAEALSHLLAGLDSADLLPPEAKLHFGPFRVLRKIGEGGMGEVFLGVRENADFEQHVAIKRVRRIALTPSLHRRFLRERQALARLQHEGIAHLIDGGFCADGRAWLAMEYIEGQSLFQHVREQKLDITARVALLRRICAAVAYAHRNLIVHCDIKPGNVLVTPSGDPKLLDFGIAQVLDEAPGNLTLTGQPALTPRYAAPEQLAGERTTTATDVHALGVLLYELVAEVSPFSTGDGDNSNRTALTAEPPPLAEVLHKQRAQFPRGLWRRVTGDLNRIAQKALAKSPADRYAEVAALDADLSDWLDGKPLRSGIGSARAQTAYLLHRYRWPLALVAAVLLALSIGALAAWQQAKRASQQAQLAQEHLAALLEVLGSANPNRFSGRDPVASEFLLDAATVLAQRRETDPALVRRALLEIGHGLINLDRLPEAEIVLTQALEAASRDVGASADAHLAILALLASSQNRVEAHARLPATVARIDTLARDLHASPQAAVDALSRAAGTLARLGEGDTALRLFSRMQTLLDAHPELPANVIENALRQRGWAALRMMDVDTASIALERAAAIARAAPQTFSELRRAEAEWLLAQVALMRGDSQTALAKIAAARAAFEAEYAQEHTERAAFDLLHARALAMANHTDAAAALLAIALPVLQSHSTDFDGDIATAHALRAELSARRGDCDSAHQALAQAQATFATLQPALPRDAALLEHATLQVQSACR